jgi:signal peptidase II
VSDQPSTTSAGPRRSRVGLQPVTFLLAGSVVALDQVTKALVRAFVPLHGSRVVIPGFFEIAHVENSGAAFGILNAAEFPMKQVVIAVIATVALIAIALYAAQLSPHQKLARYGLALILGGALGNLIDRLAFGHVIDFVDLYWRQVHFWAFNVADSAITVGVIGMMLDMIGAGSKGQD